tara:strand:- start:7782 stop:8060 length:279 start_codon:yes stop_codon:yes gene_type:complete
MRDDDTSVAGIVFRYDSTNGSAWNGALVEGLRVTSGILYGILLSKPAILLTHRKVGDQIRLERGFCVEHGPPAKEIKRNNLFDANFKEENDE